MRVIILLLLLFSINTVFTQNIKRGKTSLNQLEALKNDYNWSSQKYLIIAYRNTKSKCYNYSKDEIKTNEWVLNLMAKTKIENSHKILITFDNRSYANNKEVFIDKNKFIFKQFLNTNTCFSLIVIKDSGAYVLKQGEFTDADIHKFVNLLY